MPYRLRRLAVLVHVDDARVRRRGRGQERRMRAGQRGRRRRLAVDHRRPGRRPGPAPLLRRRLGVNSIDIMNFGHETGHETGPSSGPN